MKQVQLPATDLTGGEAHGMQAAQQRGRQLLTAVHAAANAITCNNTNIPTQP